MVDELSSQRSKRWNNNALEYTHGQLRGPGHSCHWPVLGRLKFELIIIVAAYSALLLNLKLRLLIICVIICVQGYDKWPSFAGPAKQYPEMSNTKLCMSRHQFEREDTRAVVHTCVPGDLFA